jgi:type VI secretion system secreted protein Hcp
MAIDVYLQIDGIKGESKDAQHKDWIECSSVHWSMSQPKSATSSTGGGHTAERAEFSDVNITKVADLASPILAQHCAMGKTIPKVVIEFMRADGGEAVKYYEVTLENVLIGMCAQGVSAGDVMQEQLGLKFGKVTWKYCQQKIAGGAGGNTAGGWDLSTNRVAACGR